MNIVIPILLSVALLMFIWLCVGQHYRLRGMKNDLIAAYRDSELQHSIIISRGTREEHWIKRCQEAEHEGEVLFATLKELRDELRGKGILNRLPVRFVKYLTYTERVLAKHLKIRDEDSKEITP